MRTTYNHSVWAPLWTLSKRNYQDEWGNQNDHNTGRGGREGRVPSTSRKIILRTRAEYGIIVHVYVACWGQAWGRSRSWCAQGMSSGAHVIVIVSTGLLPSYHCLVAHKQSSVCPRDKPHGSQAGGDSGGYDGVFHAFHCSKPIFQDDRGRLLMEWYACFWCLYFKMLKTNWKE